MSKSAAFHRCHYRARCNDSARDYNRRAMPWAWWAMVRGIFPNLHMRRKCPGWLRTAALGEG